MIYLAWITSLVAVFLLGYHFARIAKRIEKLEVAVKTKIDKPVDEPKSELIDPDDEVQTALYEHEKMMKKLNP